ncbi:MAG: hypothetical protein ACR2H3_08140 [Acidimicrobiales bacterium]
MAYRAIGDDDYRAIGLRPDVTAVNPVVLAALVALLGAFFAVITALRLS